MPWHPRMHPIEQPLKGRLPAYPSPSPFSMPFSDFRHKNNARHTPVEAFLCCLVQAKTCGIVRTEISRISAKVLEHSPNLYRVMYIRLTLLKMRVGLHEIENIILVARVRNIMLLFGFFFLQ